MRYAVFTHRNFNFHAGVIHLAQHFFDAADGLTIQARWLGQLNHYNLADHRLGGRTFVD